MERPIKVLLVSGDLEEDRLVQEAFAEAQELRAERTWIRPCELVITGNAVAALEILADEPADVILLDLILPEGQGVQAFLRFQASVPEIPVVLLADAAAEYLAINLVRQGAQDYLLKSELDCIPLARAIRCALERNKVRTALRSLAFFDGVTGLYSPGGFHHLGAWAWKLAELAARPLSLYLFELEGLDTANATRGRQETDLTLIIAADVLRDSFTQFDVIGRLHGGRFAVISQAAEGDRTEEVVRRIRETIQRRRRDPCAVTVRAASARASNVAVSVDDLLREAETLLWDNKRSEAPIGA